MLKHTQLLRAAAMARHAVCNVATHAPECPWTSEAIPAQRRALGHWKWTAIFGLF